MTSMTDGRRRQGTHIADPKVSGNYSQMVAEATPEFYLEHLKRLRKNEIQPYFALGHVHSSRSWSASSATASTWGR